MLKLSKKTILVTVLMFAVLALTSGSAEAKKKKPAETPSASASATPSAEASASTPAPADGLVFVKGRKKYHRAGCRMIKASKKVESITPDEVKKKGFTACKVCKP